MSDVEKAISGLVEDEELLQNQQQQQQQQLQQQYQQLPQHNPQQYQQQSTPLNKIIANNYNLQNETGNNKQLLQKHQQQHHNKESEHLHTLNPPHSSTFVADSSSSSEPHQQHTCLSRLFKLIFSTPGLVVMVVVYTIMGAFIFPLLEAPQDISKSALIAKSREECLKELWIITEKLNVLYERNWTMLVHEQLRRFEGTIVAATRNMAAGATANGAAGATAGQYTGAAASSGSMATESSTTALGRYGSNVGGASVNNNNNLLEYSDFTATRWSFSEALLYSVTVITTIGHGSLTPRTAGGKIATIFYALIGVPLMLMCLSSLGALLAEALQCTYARLCCRRWPHYVHDEGGGGGGGGVGERGVSDDLENDIKHSKQKHMPTQHSQHIKHHLTAEINAEKQHHHQLHHHEMKQHLQHSCDFQEHKNQINCKNCKYDAIIGESNTKTNHDDNDVVGYDYKLCNNDDNNATITATTLSSSGTAQATGGGVGITTSAAMTTIKRGHKEDCCQLLQNSPGKITQHLSSCMQLKMSPTNNTTSIQHQQQQQQQQPQYYQQRPDVMLMTTGHKLSSQQAASIVAPTMATACRMILPSSQTQTRFYTTSNNTAAPAPLATYHIVSSASANSSPTHHQSIRHYIVPQMPPPPTQSNLIASSISSATSSSSTSAPVTQHFMAVPSSMLRFHQTSPQTSIQQQQQQQQCSGVSGVNTTSNININPLALPVSGSATVYFPIVTPAAANTQGPQPLVKYHTIQMPHKRHHTLSLVQQTDLENNHEIDATLFPPPPPPAYQTATVHGIRRAKFLTKPLPQEINTLMHESDISCRHDLSQNLNSEQHQQQQQQPQHSSASILYSPTSTLTNLQQQQPIMLSSDSAIETETSLSSSSAQAVAATSSAGNNFYVASQTSTSTAASAAPTATLTTNNTTTIYENHESTQHQQPTHVGTQIGVGVSGGGLNSTGVLATSSVDIMEDEEEQEQQRLGNCPHGTPSRVPLLNSSATTTEDKSHTRSFLNATAASFHRHTLNPFQRSNHSLAHQRKSVIINRKGECNLHIPKRRNSSAASLCYGDHYEDTSDDDLGGLEGSNIYKLKHLHPSHPTTDKHHTQDDFCDNHSLVSLSDSANSQIPQVPIIVVLFILIFYVCLGTVIFALWENWSLIDGAYFCFVTLTTIGYGDFMPLKTFQGPEIQLFACCAYLLLGLVLVAMSFSILETQLIWKCKRLAVRLKLAKE